MCTYNGAAYVREQLQCVLNQTRLPDQLVVADDGSTDGTLDIIRATIAEFRSQNLDADLEYLELPSSDRLGVAGNFERALLATTGDYVALCDQDDTWVPDRLAALTGALDKRPKVALVHGDADLIDAEGQSLGLTLFDALGVSAYELSSISAGRGFDMLLRRNLVTGATTVVRRAVIELALPIPAGWIHDEWLGIMAAAAWRTGVTRRPLVGYRQHGENQIGANKLDMRGRIRKLREPREERNANLLERAESLVACLEEHPGQVSARHRALARLKLKHERMRFALPEARRKRIRPVLVEWARGRYARFGLGLQDVLRDLIQPSV